MQVMFHGQSLSTVREDVYTKLTEPRDRGFSMELVQGVCRWRWKLDAILLACLNKPLRKKEKEIKLLLYLALYELLAMHTPDYAVVDEAVKLTRKLSKPWAKALVNAVLRNFLRESESILASLDETAGYSHPSWLIERIRADWPNHWQSVLQHNNERAPLTLRVNRLRTTRQDYLTVLTEHGLTASVNALSDDAITLTDNVDITSLPGFSQGLFSVQDAGAQLAAPLLQCEQGMSVLDLCAAPGGKTCHVLESTANKIEMLAVDVDATRVQRIEQNLQRLQLQAMVRVADAADAASLAADAFQRILVDAPCSATGVIRRHPDIKSLRQADDIETLVALQAAILNNAWRSLQLDGLLLYVTCSVLRDENSLQMERFLQQHSDAVEQPLAVDWGQACSVGRQLLPGEQDADGFYYCLVRKCG